jgi:hypothetical protein
MQAFVAGQDGWSGACGNGFGINGITVVIIEDNEVVVAMTGVFKEFAGLVSVDLSSRGQDVSKTIACASAVRGVERKSVIRYGVRGDGRLGRWCRFGLSGALVLKRCWLIRSTKFDICLASTTF